MPPSTAVRPRGLQTTTSNKFTWKITNFTELTDVGCRSQTFTVGGAKWKVIIHPRGTATFPASFCAEVLSRDTSQPDGWTRNVILRFIVVNQSDHSNSRTKEAEHVFASGNSVCMFLNMVPLSELCDSTKGFLVNHTVVIEVGFAIREIEPVGEHLTTFDKFTWKINNFPRLTASKYISQIFTIADSDWELLIFPGGKKTGYLSVYLEVANRTTLPEGWTRMACFSISVVNQINADSSLVKATRNEFKSTKVMCVFKSMMLLSEILNPSKGYLLNDTLIVEVKFDLPEHDTCNESMSSVPVSDMLDPYFTRLEQLIIKAETSTGKAGCSHPAVVTISKTPKKKEVEKAKQTLKECLSDLYKLNMRERMAEALSTLSSAHCGLSIGQRKAVKVFRANFGECTSDLLAFELDNSEFELQRLTKDQIFTAMKKSHEAHLLNKRLLQELDEEEEELRRKLEGVESKRQKLTSDWEILLAEAMEEKSQYEILEKKVAEAEEKKRIAEERMSRSTTVWSNLKAHFT